MLDHFEFRLLRHKTLMRKHSSGIDSTRTRSLPSKLDCKRARVWGRKRFSKKMTTFITIRIVTGENLVKLHEHICTSTMRKVKSKLDA